MLSISEKMILVEPAGKDDRDFVIGCYNQYDFNLYFDVNKFVLSDYYVLRAEKKRIAIAALDKQDTFGVESVRVALYVIKDYRLLSTFCILAVLRHCINCFCGIERIEFYVYGNNKSCIKLFEQMGIMPECVYPNVKKNKDEFYELYCFAIYPDEDMTRLKTSFERIIRI